MSEKLTIRPSCLAAGLGSLLALTAAAGYPPPGSLPSLGFLLGKRVTSTVRLQKADDPAGATARAGVGTTMVMAGPSEQAISRVLTVKKGKGAVEVVIGQTISRVQMTILSPLGKSTYDSDNSFERDAVTAALGQRFDPYVGKSQASTYAAGQAVGTVPPKPEFESLWTTNVPALVGTTALQGIVLARLPASLAPGSTWTDSVRTGTTLTINKYQVVKKEGDLLRLTLNSQLAPGSATRQTSSGNVGTVSATSTLSTVTYEGELQVRQASGFIEELHLIKQASGTVSAAGQTLVNSSRAKVDITNAIE